MTDSLSPPVTVRVNAPVNPAAAPFTNGRTGQGYQTIYAARDASRSGDTILVMPGTVTQSVGIYHPLTLKSAVPGQKWFLNRPSANGDVVRTFKTSLTIEDCEISSVQTLYSRGAGIATEGDGWVLTVRRCKIHKCCNGILIGLHAHAAEILIEDSEFVDCGTADGLTHNLYLGQVKRATLRGCWSHNSLGNPGIGHLFKCRALETVLIGNRFTAEGGRNSRAIDVPNGGRLTARGNIFELGPNQDNHPYGQVCGYGHEGAKNLTGNSYEPERVHEFRFEQNTVVNHGGQFVDSYGISKNLGLTPTVVSVKDNVFGGPNAAQDPDNSRVELDQFVDHAAHDYRLKKQIRGSRNWATHRYAHPVRSVPRSDALRGAVPE